MATEAAEGREAGIGGKLRTRQPRRAPVTPYDRPAAAAAAARGQRGGADEGRTSGWMSKLVDPASAFITREATRLFSSVFRRRLGAPPAEESPVASFEPRRAAPDACDNNPLPEIQKQGSKYRDDLRNHSNSDGISELEQLLKEKTFTRAEYDQLMKLLHSRTVDVPKEEENKIIEPSTLLPPSDYEKQGDENLPPQESRIGSSMFIGITSTPCPTLKIAEEELASPAEVAKAYMGSRSSKVSPSSLCLRSQLLREATASPSFIGFSPKSSAAPICSKPVVRFSSILGTLEDGNMTPRFRGRSAVYKMSRSPYFKGKPTITLKEGETMEGGYPGPSISTQTPRNIALSGGKQVLKRRSSVIESDVGSIGPIRRIRQKSNLVSPSEDVISEFPGKLLPAANALDIVQRSSSSIQRPFPLDEHKYITSNMKRAENQEERHGCASVPLQSREMAEKILQQLDKLLPSPKGESTEAKTISRAESPPKLLEMLHGQASKSVTKIDASQLFNVGTNGKLEGSNNFHAAGRRSSVSPMNGKAENGHSKPTFSATKMASEVKGVGSVVGSIAEIRPIMRSVDPVFLHSTDGPPQKRSAFNMQAPEDSPEKEDDSYSRTDISGPSTLGKENVEMNDHKSVVSETAVVKKTFTSSYESMSGSNIQLSKVAGKGVSDGPDVADEVASFTFQGSLPSSTQCQLPLTPTMPSLPFEEPLPSSEQNAVPVFTFGSKNTPLVFSSSVISYSDPASQKFGARSDFKGQVFESGSTTTTTTTAPVECTESDEAEKTRKAGYLPKSVGTSSSFGLSLSPTPSSFQFVASATPGHSNGSLTSASSIFLVSSASAAFLSGSSASAIASAGPTTVCSSSSEPCSSAAFSALPSFQFGAGSSAVFTDSALPVVKSVSTGSEPKVIKDSPFGNASSSAAVSSIISCTSSSIFGSSASALSGATTFCSSAGPVLGSQAAQSGRGTSPFAESTTSQFGSTASSTSGLAGSSFGFSSSAFGLSISSMKPCGSNSGFEPISTLSPGAACSNTPSSSSSTPTVTTPSLFGSSSQSTVSSIFNSGSVSSAAASSVSTFGISCATSATTSVSSSSMSPFSVFSSAGATPSVFSFTQATTTSSSAFSLTFGATTTSALPSPAVSGSSGNDRMNVEESMADDMVRAAVPVVPTFGQPSNGLAPSLPFGSTPTPSGTPVFQFASSQPSTFAPSESPFALSESPFQTTGSSEIGGNFSMGSGGGDKSDRRFIKAKRDKHRKK